MLRPRPRWGSLQRSPDPLAGFGGLLLRRGKGREGREERGRGREEREGEGKGRKGRGGKGKGHEPPHYLEDVYAYVHWMSKYMQYCI